MLIPHLHFAGKCAEAITLYEKAFNTKAGDYDYRDGKIAHAEMTVHGQRIFLNDASFDCGMGHLVLTFETADELLACYNILRQDENAPPPFEKTPYSKLSGNFNDKLGVMWGFILW